MVVLKPHLPVVEVQDFTHFPALFLEWLVRFEEHSCIARVI